MSKEGELPISGLRPDQLHHSDLPLHPPGPPLHPPGPPLGPAGLVDPSQDIYAKNVRRYWGFGGDLDSSTLWEEMFG